MGTELIFCCWRFSLFTQKFNFFLPMRTVYKLANRRAFPVIPNHKNIAVIESRNHKRCYVILSLPFPKFSAVLVSSCEQKYGWNSHVMVLMILLLLMGRNTMLMILLITMRRNTANFKTKLIAQDNINRCIQGFAFLELQVFLYLIKIEAEVRLVAQFILRLSVLRSFQCLRNCHHSSWPAILCALHLCNVRGKSVKREHIPFQKKN